MPSGWTRWFFEQYEFPFEVVYPQTLDAGNLQAKFDVLVFVDGAIPASRSGRPDVAAASGSSRSIRQSIPAEYRGWLGQRHGGATVPQLKAFLEQGGTIVTDRQLRPVSRTT